MSVRKVKKHKPNVVYSTITIALSLFLLGFFALVAVHVKSVTDYVKQSIVFTIELNPADSTGGLAALPQYLNDQPYTLPGSVQFVTAAQAMQELSHEFGDVGQLLDSSVIGNSYVFHIKAEYVDQYALGTGIPGKDNGILSQIAAQPTVKGVYYQQTMVESVANNLRIVGIIAMVLGLIVMLIAILLIDSSIRLSLYANRFLIRNMQLVGSTNDFIIRPYMRKATAQGLIGGLLASGGLAAAVFMAYQSFPEKEAILGWPVIGIVLAGTTFLGIVICWCCYRIGVRKYLSAKLDDLY